jgi:signal peptidase II
MHKRMFLPYLIAALVLILDQLTKWVVLDVIGMPTRPPLEVTSFFNLVMVWNRGISFGMFAHMDARYPLIALALIVSICVLWWNRQHTARLQHIAAGMIVGGAIGNVIDRLRFGAVADFLDFHLMGYHWPSFNIADACIVVGVGLLLWYEFSQPKHTDNKNST